MTTGTFPWKGSVHTVLLLPPQWQWMVALFQSVFPEMDVLLKSTLIYSMLLYKKSSRTPINSLNLNLFLIIKDYVHKWNRNIRIHFIPVWKLFENFGSNKFPWICLIKVSNDMPPSADPEINFISHEHLQPNNLATTLPLSQPVDYWSASPKAHHSPHQWLFLRCTHTLVCDFALPGSSCLYIV